MYFKARNTLHKLIAMVFLLGLVIDCNQIKVVKGNRVQ